MNQHRLSALLDRLTISLRAQERRAAADVGVQPVHLQILGYLCRCNRYSNTPIAVSEYLGIQKGTISQSLALLEAKGYLTKTPDCDDRRVVRLKLTENGYRLGKPDQGAPATHEALGALAPPQASALEEQLQALLARLNAGPGNRSFGACPTCVHFGRDGQALRCGLTGHELGVGELTQICREHQHADYPPKVRSTAQ